MNAAAIIIAMIFFENSDFNSFLLTGATNAPFSVHNNSSSLYSFSFPFASYILLEQLNA